MSTTVVCDLLKLNTHLTEQKCYSRAAFLTSGLTTNVEIIGAREHVINSAPNVFTVWKCYPTRSLREDYHFYI